MPRVEHIGDATLYLGDCLEILPTLGKVDAVVTDPPYGIAYQHSGGGGKRKTLNGGNPRQPFSLSIVGDNAPYDPSPILDLDIPTILWGGNHYASRLPDSAAWYVWDKHLMESETSFAECEYAWSNIDTKKARVFRFFWHGALRAGEANATVHLHPTQKPVELMMWCINQFRHDPLTILDPFMGSGTTGVACANLGRKFIGIEIEPKYFDIACRRIADAYKQPRLFEDPKPEPKQEELEYAAR